jgi:menaquinone-specific isochorismate synthase
LCECVTFDYDHFKYGKELKKKYFINEFLPSDDLIEGLHSENRLPTVMWVDRDSGMEWVGIGEVARFNSVETARSFIKELTADQEVQENIRCFGAFPFDRSLWNNHSSLLLSQWILTCEANRWRGIEISSVSDDETSQNKLIKHLDDNNQKSSNFNGKFRVELNPEYEIWQKQIREILSQIDNGYVKKVVLARQKRIKSASDLNFRTVFENIKSDQNDSFLFQIPCDNGLFMGASPERLLQVDGNKIKIDSLAGTRKRGSDRADDLRLERELLASKKDCYEQGIVTESILNTLKSFVMDQPELSDLSVKKFRAVQHLHSSITAALKDSVNIDDLLKALHPTPALGGDPKEKALKILTEIGDPDRGFYGGPVGWVSATEMEFAVGIRSTFINDDEVVLYGGCGIVKGSDSESEWDETEVKMSVMEKAIFGDRCDPT